jgi:hypothetical protein
MAKAYLYSLTDTWNSAGTTFTGIGLNVTDTASAAGSLLLDLQVGGSSKFRVTKAGVVTASGQITAPDLLGFVTASGGIDYRMAWASGVGVTFFESNAASMSVSNGISLGSGRVVGWSSTTAPTNYPDLILTRDASNTLAQRNGVNAQTFRLYNTYTDASNGEHLAFTWSSNQAKIRTVANGTGVARSLVLGTNGTDRWTLSGSTGHFLASADNTYDIGTSGDNRPRNLFVGGYLSIGDGITAPGAGTGQARIYVDTADGDLKIIFADGTVKTIVTDT